MTDRLNISLEGLPGCGKTTCLNFLSTQGYTIVDFQPIKIGNLHHCICHTQNYPKFQPKDNLVIYEHSPYTLCHIHKQGLYQQDLINHQHQAFNTVIPQCKWQPDVIIYLYCQPHISLQRIKYSDTAYLQYLYIQYETILDEINCPVPIYKINADQSIDQVLSDIHNVLRDILTHRDKLVVSNNPIA